MWGDIFSEAFTDVVRVQGRISTTVLQRQDPAARVGTMISLFPLHHCVLTALCDLALRAYGPCVLTGVHFGSATQEAAISHEAVITNTWIVSSSHRPSTAPTSASQ